MKTTEEKLTEYRKTLMLEIHILGGSPRWKTRRINKIKIGKLARYYFRTGTGK